MYVQQNTGAGGSGTHTRKRQPAAGNGSQHLKCNFAQSNILQVERSGVLHFWLTGFQKQKIYWPVSS
jgi:hypothetical protein